RWHRHTRPAARSPARPRLLRAEPGRVRHRLSKRKAVELGRKPVDGECDGLRGLLQPSRLVPDLELVTLADKDDALVEHRELAQRGRHENATGNIDLDIVRMAYEQPLQRADLVVETGK